MVGVDGQVLIGARPPLWPEEVKLPLRRPRAAQEPFWCGNGRLLRYLRRHDRKACVLSETYARVLS